MLAGINYKDIVVGTGALAERGKNVMVRFRTYRSGDQEVLNPSIPRPPHRVQLGKREASVGIERGIEGMRVGGRRELEISPHLARRRPTDEPVRVEVELLEVREPGERRSEDYPPGKRLTVSHPGEAARGLPLWSFYLGEDGHGAVNSISARPGMTWRYDRRKNVQVRLEPHEVSAVFEGILATPREFPHECLSGRQDWVYASEKGNSTSRDKRPYALCLHFAVQEKDKALCSFSLREDSPVLLGSSFYQIVSRIVDAHLRSGQDAQSEKPAGGGFRWSDD